MTLRVLRQVLILLPLILSTIEAQQVRRRYAQATVIADNWLYIDGGEVSYEAGISMAENQTIGIALSQDWTNTTLVAVSSSRPSDLPALNFQTLWWSTTRKAIFAYGGELANYSATLTEQKAQVPPESIWQFTPNGNGSGGWSEAMGPASTVPYPPASLRPAAGASISDSQYGYYLGGHLDTLTTKAFQDLPGVSYRAAPGLQTLSFDPLELTNTSDGGYFGSQYLDDGSIADPGSMLYAPLFGVGGLLILLGGGCLPNGQKFSGQGAFNNITIYDSHTRTWHFQSTTGKSPDPRTSFCAVGATSSDNTTYEIFVYGGMLNGVYGYTNDAADQIYVLSLPSFHWFQADYPSLHPRARHTCVVAGGGQMIAVGGLDPSEVGPGGTLRDAFNGSSDPWQQAIGVFDMTLLQWKDRYEAETSSYDSPDIIKQYIGGANGSRFASSWSSSAVQALFENTTDASAPSSPPVGNSTTPPATSSHSSISPKSIAGVASGCVLATIFIVVPIWYLCTKRRRPRLRSQSPELDENAKDAENSTYRAAQELPDTVPPLEIADPRPWLEMEAAIRAIGSEAPKQAVEPDVSLQAQELPAYRM